MEFHSKIQRLFGHESKEEKLRNYIATLIKREKLAGYQETKFCDPKYTALINYTREHLPNDPNVKVFIYIFIIFLYIFFFNLYII